MLPAFGSKGLNQCLSAWPPESGLKVGLGFRVSLMFNLEFGIKGSGF